MVVGKCALCEKTRELCDSHLLPAGFYRITARVRHQTNTPFG